MKTQFTLLFLLTFFLIDPVFGYNVKVQDSGKLLIEAYEKLNEGDTAQALHLYSLIHPSDTNYNIAAFNSISLLIAIKAYDKAMNMVQDGLRNPKDDEYRYMLFKGNILKSQERYDDAIAAYQIGLKKYPYNHYYSYNIALTYKEQGNYDAYLEYLKKTVIAYPFYAAVHFELGNIAKKEDKISQALMSYIMGILLEPKSNRALAALGLMNSMVIDKVTAEDTPYEFPEDVDNYEEIDNIITSYVALQPAYKSKSKVDISLIKQLQVLFETLEYDENDEGFWMQFYVSFYKKLWDKGMFENFSYYILQPSDLERYVKLVKKKEKQISAFGIWGGSAVKEYFSTIPLQVGDEMITGSRSYYGKSSGGISAIGNLKNGVKNGCWYYFHNTGIIQAKGCYDSEGKMIGEWNWYTKTGLPDKNYNVKDGKYDGYFENYSRLGTTLKQINYKNGDRQGSFKEFYEYGGVYTEQNYDADVINGKAKIFYPNQQVKYQYNNKDGKINGLLKEYFSNGKIRTITKYVDSKKDSISTSYYSTGQVRNFYTYKTGDLEGPYKTYYMDGKLSKEGQYAENKLIGENKEYYNNGNLEEIHRYDEEGKENGIAIDYDYDGIKYQEFDYKKGNIVAYRIYNKAGKIVKEDTKKAGNFLYDALQADGAKGTKGTYNIKGGKDGIWEFRDKNGVIYEKSNHDDGKLSGERIKYHPNGKVKGTSNYVNDLWEGEYLEHYNFGTLSKEGFGVNGNKSGPYYEYFINGDTSSVLFYVNDNKDGWQSYYGTNGLLRKRLLYDYNNIVIEYLYDTNEHVYDSLSYVLLNGLAVKHYPNGKKLLEGTFSNGEFNGVATWYYGNGAKWEELNYSNGTKHGTQKIYHPNGKLAKVYTVEMGVNHGKVSDFYFNGEPKEEYYYNYGDLEGQSLSFDNNGKVIGKMNYEMDKLHGKRYFYDPNGKLDHIRIYHYGKIVGYTYIGKDGKEVAITPIVNETASVKSYFKNGHLSRSYTINNGVFNGPYLEFYESGVKSEVKTYVDNNLEGEWSRYFENGQIKEQTTYIHGSIDGTYKSYHKNGKVKESGKYIIGQKYGPWKRYDLTGKLIETNNYYHNRLYDTQKN